MPGAPRRERGQRSGAGRRRGYAGSRDTRGAPRDPLPCSSPHVGGSMTRGTPGTGARGVRAEPGRSPGSGRRSSRAARRRPSGCRRGTRTESRGPLRALRQMRPNPIAEEAVMGMLSPAAAEAPGRGRDGHRGPHQQHGDGRPSPHDNFLLDARPCQLRGSLEIREKSRQHVAPAAGRVASVTRPSLRRQDPGFYGRTAPSLYPWRPPMIDSARPSPWLLAAKLSAPRKRSTCRRAFRPPDEPSGPWAARLACW